MKKGRENRLVGAIIGIAIFIVIVVIVFSIIGDRGVIFAPGEPGQPEMNFVWPTPQDGGSVRGDSIDINISSSDDGGEHSITADWNRKLALWMKMDDRDTDGNLIDFSSYSNNGSVNGSIYNLNGKYGGAFDFDGNSDFINISLSQSLDIQDEITLKAWVYPRSNGNGQDFKYVIAKPTDNYSPPYFVYAMGFEKSGRFRFLISSGGIQYKINYNLPLNKWSHVVGTYSNISNNNLSLYIDGILVNTTYVGAGKIDVSAKGVYIGGYDKIASESWDGLIDDVEIHSRALSEQEVRSNYNSLVYPYENKFIAGNGSYNFKAYAQDLNGNINFAERKIIMDNKEPGIKILPFSNNLIFNNFILDINSYDNNKDHSVIVDINKSLLLWLPFEELNSAGEVVDRSSYSSNGTIFGARQDYGRYGGGFSFDGVDDYIKIGGNKFDIRENQSFSLVAWIKTDSVGGIIMQRYDSVPYYRLSTADPSDSRIKFAIRGDEWGETKAVGNSAVNDNKWHLVAGVRDVEQDKLFVYVDGNLDGEAVDNSKGDLALQQPLWIGVNGGMGPSDAYFNGSIDDVQVYSKALSKEEIGSLYNAYLYPYKKNIALENGNYNLGVYAEDSAGNINVALRQMNVDGRIPKISFTHSSTTTYEAGKEFLINASIESSLQLDDIVFKAGDADAERDAALKFGFDKRWSLGENENLAVNSINGGVGVVNGAKWIRGKFRGAYEFDGVDDYIDVENLDMILNATPFTIAAWINPLSYIYEGNTIFFQGNGEDGGAAPGHMIHFSIGSAEENILRLNFYGAQAYATKAIPLKSWTYVSVTFDPITKTANFYVNGKKDREIGLSLAPSLDSLSCIYIGARYCKSSPYFTGDFNGSIDELMVWKRVLTENEIYNIYNLMEETKTLYDDSIILMMDFENRSTLSENETFVMDLSRRGNNGTVYGASWTADGKHGGAYAFDGDDDSINAGFLPDMEEMSIGVWVKYMGAGSVRSGWWGAETIFSDMNSSGANDVVFAVNGTHVGIRADKSGNVLERWSKEQIPLGEDITGQWHHLAWSMSSSASSVYLDGKNIKTVYENGSNVGYHGICIGCSSDYGKTPLAFFNGSIDEIRVFSRALSDEEIELVYSSSFDKKNDREWIFNIAKNFSEGSHDYMICSKNFVGEGCTESRRISVQGRNIAGDIGPNPGDGGGGGGGGGGSAGSKAIIIPLFKVEDSLNSSEEIARGEFKKIILEDEGIKSADIENKESIIVELFDQAYKISFKIDNNQVVLVTDDGEYILPQEDVLLIIFGEQERYIGVNSVGSEKAEIIFGLDKNAVLEAINENGEDSGKGSNRLKIVYYIASLIILIFIGFVSWYLVRIIKARREREFLQKLEGISWGNAGNY